MVAQTKRNHYYEANKPTDRETASNQQASANKTLQTFRQYYIDKGIEIFTY
jgi:hypothetical protein